MLWILVCIGALGYAYQQDIPSGVAFAVLAALLAETALYVAPGFSEVRERIRSAAPPAILACLLTLSAVAPYGLYSIPTGVFAWEPLGLIALQAAAVSFWYVLLPASGAANVGFLALMAAAYIGKFVTASYGSPIPELRLDFLGHLMWIRLGVSAALLIGRMEGSDYGFVPRRNDWAIGLRNYLYLLPLGIGLAYLLGFARFQPVAGAWWKAPLTFIGMFWVVALSEEFFFRGLLQQWISKWTASAVAGLLIASVLFGAAHLWFRDFPNWNFAALATVAGVFYGRAYWQAKSIRASMVTHALLVTTWRMLFS